MARIPRDDGPLPVALDIAHHPRLDDEAPPGSQAPGGVAEDVERGADRPRGSKMPFNVKHDDGERVGGFQVGVAVVTHWSRRRSPIVSA
jgi:hypothetical protein